MTHSLHSTRDTETLSPAARSTPSPTRRRAAWTLTGLTAAFLLFDVVIHLLLIQPVVDSFAMLGYPLETVRVIAVLELICLTLYLVPRTAVLGALLLTGYLGGAVSAHVRIGSPLFSTTLFAVYVGVALWLGLWLRDERIRELLPLARRG